MRRAWERGGGDLAIAAAFATLATAYVLGRSWANAWTVIDDHEIAFWIGARDRLPATEYLRTLATTELLNPDARRFRPVYFGVRVAEAVVFGKDVALWYAARALLFGSSVLLLAYTLLRWVAKGLVQKGVALAGVALVLTARFWAPTFGRIGPSEAYGIVGFSLAIAGFVAVVVGDDRRPRWYWATAVGALVAGGSKENLLIALVPLLVVAVRGWRDASASSRWVLATGVILLVADAAWVARLASNAGADIYGNSTSLAQRAGLVQRFLERPEVRWAGGVALALAAALVASRLVRRGPLASVERHVLAIVAVLLGCTAAAATQFLFYAGTLPIGHHYDFPYVLMFDGALVVAVLLGLRVLELLASRWRSARVAVGLAGAAVALGLAVSSRPGLVQTRRDVRAARDAHLAFGSRFSGAIEEIRAMGASAIVLRPHRGLSYEPVHSISRHLAARGLDVPIYLALPDDLAERAPAGLERELVAGMAGWSARGMEAIRGPPPARFGTCFSFGFDGPPYPDCAAGVQIWPVRPDLWVNAR